MAPYEIYEMFKKILIECGVDADVYQLAIKKIAERLDL